MCISRHQFTPQYRASPSSSIAIELREFELGAAAADDENDRRAVTPPRMAMGEAETCCV
jgi:hypothetical protein